MRDQLLGIEPKDYDVATAATPDAVQALFPDAHAVGAHFGVVLVRADQAQVEVATFRNDHEYSDGRRPDGVDFTRSAEQDVLRRDFTINGLLYDPLEDRVLDYVGGKADIHAGVVRAIGEAEERFREDRLRLLRAVRFAARFGFSIEPETLAAMRQHASSVGVVAKERARDEILRILTEGNPKPGFELLDESGLLEHVLPDVARMKGVEQPPQFHPEGDVWVHTLLVLSHLDQPTPTLAMGALLHDVGKPPTFEVTDRIRFNGHAEVGAEMADEICADLRFSNAERERIVSLVANHMRFMHVRDMRPAKLKRFLRSDGFDEQLSLHRADCLGSHAKLTNYEFCKQKLAEYDAEMLRPDPLLRGSDLIAAGFEPGPAFQRILSSVEDAQLDGLLDSREQALNWVRSHYPPAG